MVGNGQVDARSGSGSANLRGSCDPEDLQWRKTKAPVAGICGTQTVQDRVECVDVSGGGSLVVDETRCNAAQRPANAPYSVTGREGCAYDYTASAWPASDPACGAVTQTRTVSCMGSDGEIVSDTLCASHLTPPSAATPISEYWSQGPYAWPGAPGDAITVYRMPTVCNAGSPDVVRRDCDARYAIKGGQSFSYLRPKETRTITDTRSCQTEAPSSYAWNVPTYVPDRTNVCGPNTRSGRVFCLKDGATEVDDSLCSAETKPSAVQNFEDISGCRDEEIVTSIAEVRLGACNYTSSGGGRHACGPRGNYRGGPVAPWPSELCSGTVLAGNADDLGDRQTPNAGKNWSKPPVTEKVPGARCVVHWKYGYSDSAQAGWNSAYFSGPPTGLGGGDFIGRKP